MTRLVAVLDLNTGQFNTKLDDVQKRTGKAGQAMGTAMKAVGAGIAVAGTAAAGLAVASVKSAADFESAFANVATLMGTDAPKEIGKLKAGIMALDPALGSATDLTKGLYQAISSGIKPAESIKFMEQAAKLAGAGLADVDSVVKVLAGSMNAYGEESLNVKQVSDLLFQTVKSGVVELPELAAGLGQVSGVAAAAGVSQKELLAAISSVTKAGVPASQAMTGIKAALANIIKPTKEAADLASKLGVDFSVSGLKAKGLAGMLAEVQKATGGNTEAMAQFFGSVEGLNTVLALTRDNMAPLKEDLAASDAAIKANGAVTELAWRQQQEGFTASLTALKNAWEQILIGVGTELLPELTKTSKELLANIDSVKAAVMELVGGVRIAADTVQGMMADIGGFVGTASVVAEQAAGGNIRGAAAAAGLGEAGQTVAAGVAEGLYQGANTMTGGALGFGRRLFGGARAGGGDVAGDKAYLVGESGPELMVPGADGKVLSAGETKSMLGALPGGMGYGGDVGHGLVPGKALEDLKKRIHAAARAGAGAGIQDGAKEGAGSKGKRKGLFGELSEAAKGGSAFGTIEGIMSGDVDAAATLFQKGFGKGLAEEAKAMLVKALGKKLLQGIFGGGFGGFFAEGGNPPVGQVSVVGERGPEFFVPRTAGTIVPMEPGRSISISIGELRVGEGIGSAASNVRRQAESIAEELVTLLESGRGDRFVRAVEGRMS